MVDCAVLVFLLKYINPDGLSKNPAFLQIVTTQGKGKTIYIGGQDAVNAQREIVGKGDIAEQAWLVMKNLQTALSACGATFENLVKLSIYIVQGQDLYRGFPVPIPCFYYQKHDCIAYCQSLPVLPFGQNCHKEYKELQKII